MKNKKQKTKQIPMPPKPFLSVPVILILTFLLYKPAFVCLILAVPAFIAGKITKRRNKS